MALKLEKERLLPSRTEVTVIGSCFEKVLEENISSQILARFEKALSRLRKSSCICLHLWEVDASVDQCLSGSKR